jgi:hypothetical protein
MISLCCTLFAWEAFVCDSSYYLQQCLWFRGALIGNDYFLVDGDKLMNHGSGKVSFGINDKGFKRELETPPHNWSPPFISVAASS